MKMSLVRSWIVPLIIFIVVFGISAYFAQFNIDLIHDGITFKAAYDITHGKMLFSQTYTHYGPVAPYLQALTMSLFGNYVLMMRWSTAFMYGLIGVLLWLIWSKFLSRTVAAITVLLYICFAPYYFELFYPWPSVYGLFFLVVALYMFVSSPLNKVNNVLIGAVLCFAFLSKQPFLIISIGIGAYYILLWLLKVTSFAMLRKQIVSLAIGFLSTYIIFLLWIMLNGAARDYWLQVIREGYTEGKIISFSLYKNIYPFFSHHPVWILIALSNIYFLLTSFFSLLRKKKDTFQVTILGVSIISLSSIAQWFPLLDESHVYWAATPAIGLFVYFLQQIGIKIWRDVTRIKKINQKEKRYLIGYALIILVSFSIIVSETVQEVQAAYTKVTQNYVRVTSPRVMQGMLFLPADASFFSDVSAAMTTYLNKHPDKTFVIESPNSLFMAFTDRAVNVLPEFANYSGYTSGYYPFETKLYEYIKVSKPLVMVNEDNIKKLRGYGYHIVKQWNYKDEVMTLMSPDEKQSK